MKTEKVEMKAPRQKYPVNIILLLCAIITLITLLTSCASSTTTTSQSSTATTTTPSATNLQPMEVVSLTGPLPPVNPGGPNVEMVLKNITTEPVITLNVTLELNVPFKFVFDVALPTPALPGKNMSAVQTLLNGGFNASTFYPLHISGTFQNGSTFDYVKQVQIAPGPAK